MNKQTEALLREKPELTDAKCREAMDFAVKQVRNNLTEFTESFKKSLQ